MGDFNASIGKRSTGDNVGDCGLDSKNQRWELLIDFWFEISSRLFTTRLANATLLSNRKETIPKHLDTKD